MDDQDNRADGLLNLLEQLPKLEYIPEYFFLENVPNFEVCFKINTLEKKKLLDFLFKMNC